MGARSRLFESFGLRPKDEPATLPPYPRGTNRGLVFIEKHRGRSPNFHAQAGGWGAALAGEFGVPPVRENRAETVVSRARSSAVLAGADQYAD